MKKITIILVIVLLFMGLSSCSMKESDGNQKTYFEDPIKIILPLNADVKGDDKYGEYASELLAAKGFNVEFIFYKVNPFDRIHISKEKYREFVLKEINKDENIIFEAWGDFERLESKGQLLKLGESREFYVNNSIARYMYDYTGVYVNRKFEEKFGKAISSIDEYEEFLYWAKENVPNLKPGVIYTQGGNFSNSFSYLFYDRNIPLSLFAQANGYIKSNLFLAELNYYCNTIYFQLESLKDSSVTPDVRDATELPFFLEMDEKLNKWTDEGLVYLSDNRFNAVSNCASFIQNVMSSSERYNADKEVGKLYKIDAGDYNLRILTADGVIPDSVLPGFAFRDDFRLAASRNSPTPLAIQGLLDWIYKDEENYIYFMCGIEGVDYKKENDRIEFLTNEKGLVYGEWYGHAPFANNDFDFLYPNFPYNWMEVKSQIEDVTYFDILLATDLWKSDVRPDLSDIKDKLDLSYSDYRKVLIDIYTKYYHSISSNSSENTAYDLQKDILSSKEVQSLQKYYESLVGLYYGK